MTTRTRTPFIPSQELKTGFEPVGNRAEIRDDLFKYEKKLRAVRIRYGYKNIKDIPEVYNREIIEWVQRIRDEGGVQRMGFPIKPPALSSGGGEAVIITPGDADVDDSLATMPQKTAVRLLEIANKLSAAMDTANNSITVIDPDQDDFDKAIRESTGESSEPAEKPEEKTFDFRGVLNSADAEIDEALAEVGLERNADNRLALSNSMLKFKSQLHNLDEFILRLKTNASEISKRQDAAKQAREAILTPTKKPVVWDEIIRRELLKYYKRVSKAGIKAVNQELSIWQLEHPDASDVDVFQVMKKLALQRSKTHPAKNPPSTPPPETKPPTPETPTPETPTPETPETPTPTPETLTPTPETPTPEPPVRAPDPVTQERMIPPSQLRKATLLEPSKDGLISVRTITGEEMVLLEDGNWVPFDPNAPTFAPDNIPYRLRTGQAFPPSGEAPPGITDNFWGRLRKKVAAPGAPFDPTRTGTSEEERKKARQSEEEKKKPPGTIPVPRPQPKERPPEDPPFPRDDPPKEKEEPKKQKDTNDRDRADGVAYLRPFFTTYHGLDLLGSTEKESIEDIKDFDIYDIPVPENETLSNPLYAKIIAEERQRFSGVGSPALLDIPTDKQPAGIIDILLKSSGMREGSIALSETFPYNITGTITESAFRESNPAFIVKEMGGSSNGIGWYDPFKNNTNNGFGNADRTTASKSVDLATTLFEHPDVYHSVTNPSAQVIAPQFGSGLLGAALSSVKSGFNPNTNQSF